MARASSRVCVLEHRDALRREPLRDDAAVLRVLGRVHVEHQQADTREVVLGELEDVRSTAPRREQLHFICLQRVSSSSQSSETERFQED